MNHKLRHILIGLTLAAAVAGCSRSTTTDANSADAGSDNSAAPAGGGAASGKGGGRMAAWRAKFPGTAAVVTNIFGLHDLLKSGHSPVTPTQAKTIIGVVQPLLTAPTLTQDQAAAAAKTINSSLTPSQQQEIGTLRQQRRRNRGAGTGGGGAGGGGAGGGGASSDVPRPATKRGGGAGKMAGIFNDKMTATTNPFLTGRPHNMLQETVRLLQTAQG